MCTGHPDRPHGWPGRLSFDLRARLLLLIRQHQLDPALVKRYATDFFGTEALREAGRDLVDSFITRDVAL